MGMGKVLPIVFFTIVRNGMPWIGCHLPIFNRLTVPWHWIVIEGYARPVKDTSWCKHVDESASNDGTCEYLNCISSHHRRVHYRSGVWNGKTAMVNEALNIADQIVGEMERLVWQIDADEIWSAHQIEIMHDAMSESDKTCAIFDCNYYIGPELLSVGSNCYGHKDVEWARLWRVGAGERFEKHEPPLFNRVENTFSKEETKELCGVFDHYAYCLDKDVRFKEEYYGYSGALRQWENMQENAQSGEMVCQYLRWVKDSAKIERKQI